MQRVRLLRLDVRRFRQNTGFVEADVIRPDKPERLAPGLQQGRTDVGQIGNDFGPGAVGEAVVDAHPGQGLGRAARAQGAPDVEEGLVGQGGEAPQNALMALATDEYALR